MRRKTSLSPGAEQYGAVKQDRIVALIDAGDFVAFPDGAMAALGVARRDDRELLVTTLDDVALDALAEGRLATNDAPGQPGRRRA